MRLLLPMFLFVLSYFIGQLYQLFDTPYYNDKGPVNWIWLEQRPMLIAWNVKFLSEEVCRVVEAIAVMIIAGHTGIKVLKLTATAYLTYRCLDFIVWFVNFKTYHYWYVFFVLAFIELWLWYRDDITKYLKNNRNGTN